MFECHFFTKPIAIPFSISFGRILAYAAHLSDLRVYKYFHGILFGCGISGMPNKAQFY